MSDNITLSVYFSGTSHEINDRSMLASVLHTATETDEQNLKMGFNGCGIDYGLSGVLFGSGLEEQCKAVVDNIIQLLKAGKRVKLNAYGHSRGGIACLLLAKMLGKFDRDLVEVNLALMDPVPGNLVATSTIDFTHRTLARKAMDVSECRNLNQVLTIYPNTPLHDLDAHAPLIPQYPTNCQVTEEIIPGCHAGAQLVYQNGDDKIFGRNEESNITFNLISRFLVKLGTKFNFLKSTPSVDQEKEMDSHLLNAYDKSLATQQKTAFSRACHAKSSVAIKTNWPATYLSPLHKKLKQQEGNVTIDTEPNDSQKNQEYAYFFSSSNFRKTKNPLSKEEPSSKLEDQIALFADFLNEIYSSGMSSKSKNSSKGFLIKECADKIQTEFLIQNEALLKDVMRNAFALCLQRDRNTYSPFSTTQSGHAAVKLLNSNKYQPLTKMVLNTNDKKVRYRDLRTFILGRNDKAYFNAKKSKSMYQLFQPINNSGIVSSNLEPDKTSRLFTNNMKFYLS